MGDRANVFLADQIDREQNTATGIYIYTHWRGYEWPEDLRAALEVGKSRWGDEQYLNRVLVREMFANLNGETGGGLSTRIGDNEWPIIVVNHDDQTVHFVEQGCELKPCEWGDGMAFADYVAESRAYPTSVVA